MGGKHGMTRSMTVAAATVAVCGVAILIGYAMGNYAITAITTMRHRPSRIVQPEPAAESTPASPEPAPGGSTPQPASRGEAPGGNSRLLTQLQDGARKPAASASAPVPAPTTKRTPDSTPLYRVHVGPFATRQEAVAAAGRLLADGYPTFVLADRPYRVQVGAFRRREAATRLVSELKAKNYPSAQLVEP